MYSLFFITKTHHDHEDQNPVTCCSALKHNNYIYMQYEIVSPLVPTRVYMVMYL